MNGHLGLDFADSDARLRVLANYNAERSRGIMHTPEWQERMAKLQAEFDAHQRREMLKNHDEIAPGVFVAKGTRP